MKPRRLDIASNLVWALLIIAAGGLWLLNLLGGLSPFAVDLIQRGWPVLFVAVGLMLLIGRRIRFGNVLAILLSAAVVAGVTMVAYSQQGGKVRTENTVPIAYAVPPEVTRLRITINVLTTSITIKPGTDRAFSGQFVGSLESKITGDLQSANGIGTFTLRESPANAIPLLNNIGRGVITLTIPAGIDVEQFTITGRDGSLTLDSTGVNVNRLSATLDAGALDVKLADHAGLIADLKTARGDAAVTVPAALIPQITLANGRADAARFDQNRFLPNNNVLQPRVSAGVQPNVQINIDATGAITIR